MTSLSTLVERLRRAAQSGESTRDCAVVLSEFIDEGGVELLDDPFHPARRDRVEGLIAPIASTKELSVVIARSAAGLTTVPQRHELPVVLGILSGRVAVDVFMETESSDAADKAESVEIDAGEVYVIEPDVIHDVRFVGDEPGSAIHVVLGDLGRTERSRWVDRRHQRVAPSLAYPLSALPMAEVEPAVPDEGDSEDYSDATA